jgi:hypothetical protein
MSLPVANRSPPASSTGPFPNVHLGGTTGGEYVGEQVVDNWLCANHPTGLVSAFMTCLRACAAEHMHATRCDTKPCATLMNPQLCVCTHSRAGSRCSCARLSQGHSEQV